MREDCIMGIIIFWRLCIVIFWLFSGSRGRKEKIFGIRWVGGGVREEFLRGGGEGKWKVRTSDGRGDGTIIQRYASA